MKAKRKVVVFKSGNSTWAVAYVTPRRYRGRYWAASFYAPDHTLEKVQDWVRSQPNLELTD